MTAGLRAPAEVRTGAPPPLLLVGHGTVDPAGVAEFAAFTERVRARMAPAGVDVGGGVIELSSPTVHDAWSALAARGHTTMAAVPLVLVAAGHAKGDIPAALARERVRDPRTGFVLGRPLGPHPVLLDLLDRRVGAVLRDAGWDAGGVTVLLVGRGSTDPDANAEVCKVARLLQEGRGYAGVETAFVSLARPDVVAGLVRCHALGARRVVVAPYFLFDGVLPRRVAAQAAAFDGAGLDVRTAGYLGDCDALAGLVGERYAEALAGDIRMNCDTCAHRVLLPGFEGKLGAPQTPHHHPHDPTHGHGHGN
ncbi:MAG: sirohydrochlorin chelatase [Pseudonocardia sp.]